MQFVKEATHQKDLASSGVAGAPPDEVVGNDNRLLGLACNVTAHHAEAERLGRPEGEGDVIADEQTDSGAEVLVRDGLHGSQCEDCLSKARK